MINPKPGPQSYHWNLILAIDQLGNAVFGGNRDQTISGRLGQIKRANGGVIPRWKGFGLARPLDEVLELIQRGHSAASIEEDEE